MTVCIFGASGKTGQHLVKQALEHEYSVIAVARQASAIQQSSPTMSTIEADVLVPDSLAFLAKLTDKDHVVVALGSKELKGNVVRSEGMKNIIEALQKAGIKPRLSVISAAGVHESAKQLGLFSKIIAKLMLGSVMREHALQETIVENSGLPFTIFRPSGLVDKNASKRFQIVTEEVLKPTTIERAALANGIIGSLKTTDWVGQKLTLTRRP